MSAGHDPALPLVDAVLPTYNYARYIRRAVESVFSQTYPNIQCIVVDDGSTDETHSILAGYAGRIRVITLAHRGVCAARNAGIRAGSAPLVALLDADDWWHPEKIERQVRHLQEHPELLLVGCGLSHMSADLQNAEVIRGSRTSGSSAADFRAITIRKFWIGGSDSGAMVRRSAFDKVGLFDESLEAAEDWDLWMRMAAAGPVDNVPEPLTYIHRHATGMFRNPELMLRNQLQVHRKSAAAFPKEFDRSLRRRALAMILTDAAVESQGTGHVGRAFRYVSRAIVSWPASRKAWRLAAVLLTKGLLAKTRLGSRRPAHD